MVIVRMVIGKGKCSCRCRWKCIVGIGWLGMRSLDYHIIIAKLIISTMYNQIAVIAIRSAT